MCCKWVGTKSMTAKNNRREGVAEGQRIQREFSKYPFQKAFNSFAKRLDFLPWGCGKFRTDGICLRLLASRLNR